MKGLALANGTVPVMARHAEEEVRICDPGGRGLLFPLCQGEQEWNWILRAVIYALALVYLFLGVNIVADKFVSSIETITSKKKRVREKGTGRLVTVAVWNGTVANLTLLALGSSAPEILLSIVETVRNNFHSGELGPSTIIGSAAFNLFMIIAVCIMAIPNGELRAVKESAVFAVTAVFSLLAYFWLVFIVQISSPDVVEIWEGVLTMAFLPVLIFVSYAADVGMWPFRAKADLRKGKLTSEPVPALQDQGIRPPHLVGVSQRPAGGGVASFVGGGPDVLTDDTGRPIGGAAGVVCFGEDSREVSAGLQRKWIMVPVYRQNGTEGTVTCKYRTEALTAVPGYDYSEAEGELVFDDREAWAEAFVELLPKRLGEHSDQFQLILEDLEGGAVFNPYSDGGEGRCVLTVTILNENDGLAQQSVALRAGRALDGCLNLDSLRRGTSDWYGEIKSSVLDVNGDDDEPPSLADYFMHIISIPWKLLFAVLVPPTAYLGGWLCFCQSLAVIGGLTAIVIDFAELFGCVTGIEDSITAITFVALGTSMPDLFASVSAAKADETADASIVNVTGSNSVNVFVGIGVPWTMAAIYWQVQGPTADWVATYSSGKHRGLAQAHPGGGFIVPGGDLAFGVVVFTVAALMALALLRLRRVKLGGELGGPFGPKVLSSFMLTLLWLFYVGLYIWKVVTQTADVWSQVSAIFIALMVLENVLLVAAFLVYAFGSSGPAASKYAVSEEDEEKPLPPPPLPPPLSGHASAFFQPALAGQSAAPLANRAQASRGPGRAGRLHVSGPEQHFEAGIMGPTMLSAESLAPIVSVEAITKVISFSSAAMVCLAANRLKRPVKARAPGVYEGQPQRPAGMPHRPAGLPPAYSVTLDSLASPPAPPEDTLQRSNSFYSLDSGSGSAATRSCSPPVGYSNARGGGGGGGAAGALESLGGRVAGWVGEHRADGVALCVAGLAAAQLA